MSMLKSPKRREIPKYDMYNTPTSSLVHEDESYSESLEKSKLNLYSALFLILKNKMEVHCSSAMSSQIEGTWKTLQDLVARHETTIDKITVDLVNYKSKLSSNRIEQHKKNVEARDSAFSELSSIRERLNYLSRSNIKSEISSIIEKKANYEAKNQELREEIGLLERKLSSLSNETAALKLKKEEENLKYQERAAALVSTQKNVTTKASSLDSKINELRQQIEEITKDIEEKTSRRDTMAKLCETIKSPRNTAV